MSSINGWTLLCCHGDSLSTSTHYGMQVGSPTKGPVALTNPELHCCLSIIRPDVTASQFEDGPACSIADTNLFGVASKQQEDLFFLLAASFMSNVDLFALILRTWMKTQHLMYMLRHINKFENRAFSPFFSFFFIPLPTHTQHPALLPSPLLLLREDVGWFLTFPCTPLPHKHSLTRVPAA